MTIEGHQPRAPSRLPDGRGGDSEKSVRGHSAADRGTSTAARHIDSVRRSIVLCSLQIGEVRLDDRKLGIFWRSARWRLVSTRRQRVETVQALKRQNGTD
jgi:hypothetical protein